MGCGFVAGQGSAAGSFANFPGVLSNSEIREMVIEKGIKPYLNEMAMVKYLTYEGDSWMRYDDTDTYAVKEAFANDRCLAAS